LGVGGGGDTPLILIQLERKTRRSRFRAFIDVQETFTYYKFDKIQAIFEIVKFLFVRSWDAVIMNWNVFRVDIHEDIYTFNQQPLAIYKFYKMCTRWSSTCGFIQPCMNQMSFNLNSEFCVRCMSIKKLEKCLEEFK
jgi:hypothetical protein